MKWIFGGIFLFLVIGLVTIAAGLGFGYWDFTNQSNKYENGIQAKYKDNQNVYDNGVKKVIETFGVSNVAADKVKEVTVAAIQGRYGANGAQAVFQTLQEDNPKLDLSLYIKVQQIIEEFRNQFEFNQRELLSQWQVYKNFLTATRSGTFYNQIAGVVGGKFPRINEDKFGIVTSNRTENAFTTKKDEAIDLKAPANTQAENKPSSNLKAPTPTKKAMPPVITVIPAGGQLPPQPRK